MYNKEITIVFDTIADLLSIQGANPFRVRAYRQAARIVEGASEEFRKKVERGDDLTELSGIGDDLAAKIEEMVETGECQFLKDLQQEVPMDLQKMLSMEDLGPKRVQQLYEELEIRTLQDLEGALEAGSIQELDGFGEKITASLKEQIKDFEAGEQRYLRADIEVYVAALQEFLDQHEAVSEVAVAGSYRRKKETVGDIDFLAVSDEPKVVMKDFVTHDDVERVLNHGETKSSVLLRMGVQVDLRIVDAESYGAALQYFTGSKSHNIAFRKRALEHGYTVNEYGIFKREGGEAGEKVAGEIEESMYQAIGLEWVPPEMRTNSGEIELAAKNELPSLIEATAIRGDLHMHTTASDGRGSIEEMIAAAEERGYDYIAITDHAERIGRSGQIDWEGILEHRKAVRTAAESTDLKVYFGLECNIGKEGELQLTREQVAELDLVVISIHTYFDLDGEIQTERMLKALDQPVFTIWGHPTGRHILKRDAVSFDFDRIVERAAELDVVIELNAQPKRLDLNGRMARRARELGAQLIINSDAHRPQDLERIRYGVDMARRAWLEADDVLNTQESAAFLQQSGD